MKNRALPAFILLLLSTATAAGAADTPETLLIRQALNNDKFGMRRGIEHLDVALSAVAPNFVVYAGNNTLDPRGWQILHEDREAYAQTLSAKLTENQYDIERAIPHILVLEKKAVATTLDSGFVINRTTGSREFVKSARLWTFMKFDEEWLATAYVADIGEDTSGPRHPSIEDEEISVLLEEERQGWISGSASSIVAPLHETFTGLNGMSTHAPTSWASLFADPVSYEKWVSKRVRRTKYDIEREVVYVTVGPARKEALALTHDRISTGYEAGDAVHDLDRYALWTLSQRSGDWSVTNIVYDLGLTD